MQADYVLTTFSPAMFGTGATAHIRIIEAGEAQKRFWQIGVAGVGSDRLLVNFILPPLNEVIDSHSAHLSAERRHVPTLIEL